MCQLRVMLITGIDKNSRWHFFIIFSIPNSHLTSDFELWTIFFTFIFIITDFLDPSTIVRYLFIYYQISDQKCLFLFRQHCYLWLSCTLLCALYLYSMTKLPRTHTGIVTKNNEPFTKHNTTVTKLCLYQYLIFVVFSNKTSVHLLSGVIWY